MSQITQLHTICFCGKLTLAGCQTSAQTLSYSSSSSTGQEEKIRLNLMDHNRQIAYQLLSQAKQAQLWEN